MVWKSDRPGNSTGAGSPAATFRPPHAEDRPAGPSCRRTAAPGATDTDVGWLMTSSAPAAIPSHDAAPVHVPPAGMTTTLASPPGSSGRENTAPFEGAAGGVSSRRQFGPGGRLAATKSGPHRIPSPFRQPGPVPRIGGDEVLLHAGPVEVRAPDGPALAGGRRASELVVDPVQVLEVDRHPVGLVDPRDEAVVDAGAVDVRPGDVPEDPLDE